MSQPPVPPPLWSARLRHPFITLTPTTASFTISPNSQQICACACATLTSNLNLSHTWTLTIAKLTRMAALGIALESRIVSNGFISGSWFLEPDNGVYCISTDGRVYFESGRSKDSFAFRQGDSVKVRYDPRDGVIQFEKVGREGKEKKVVAKVRPPPEGDRYLACVYICPDDGNVFEVGSMQHEE